MSGKSAKHDSIERENGEKTVPLAGVKVLELGHVAAGPFSSFLLAQLGAEVTKIEPLGEGELVRNSLPNVSGGTLSAYFASVNAQKRFLQLDLKSKAGRDVFLRLASTADVIVHNMGPGRVESLKIDYANVRPVNDQIIYCGIAGFRANSVYQGLPSFDYIHEAMSGVMSMTRSEGESPSLTGLPAADMGGGLYAAFAIVTALYMRDRIHQGQNIEVPLQDCLTSLLPIRFAQTFATGEPFPAIGRTLSHFAPFGVFDTLDSFVVLTIGSDNLWRRFVEVIPTFSEDRYATRAGRVGNRESLNLQLENLFRTKTTADWLRMLRPSGVPIAPVMNTLEVSQDPYFEGQATELPLEHGSFRWFNFPVRMSESKFSIDIPPGPPGRDTDEILREAGYSANELSKLRDENVIAGVVGGL